MVIWKLFQPCSVEDFIGHPYGRSGGVSTSSRVDPGLVRTELGQLFDTRWLGLNRSRNGCPVRPYRYSDGQCTIPLVGPVALKMNKKNWISIY